VGVPTEAEGQPNREIVGAVLKACSLLEHFGTDRPIWTLNELTAASGMNKTTVHRLMATLIHAGWVDRTEDGGYRVAMRVFEVGSGALVRLDIRSAAKPYMVDLANTFGDTSYLMVPSDQGAVCIDKLEGHNPLVVAGISIGSVMPYHAAAGPIVMLAHSDDLRRRWLADDLPSFTDRTITDGALLATHLDEIRAAGYSVSNADYLAGVAAVAAPIFDRAGAVVASISIGGRVEVFDGETLDGKIDKVRTAAAAISRIVQAIPQ
jgi:DNA-binding IclR family transcriptional regulator